MEKIAKEILRRISEKIGVLTTKQISRVAYSSKYNEWHAYISQSKPHWEDISWRVKEPNEIGNTEIHVGFYSAQPSPIIEQIIQKTEILGKGKVDNITKNHNGIRLIWNCNLNSESDTATKLNSIIELLPDFWEIIDLVLCQNDVLKVHSETSDQSNEGLVSDLLPEQLEFIRENWWYQREEVPESWFNSSIFILEMIKKDREDWLSLASKEIRSNKKIIKEIIEFQPKAIEYADVSLLNDLEIVKLSISKLPDTLRYFDEQVKSDYDIVLEAVSKDGSTLQYASVNLKNNFEIVSLAVNNYGYAINYASDEMKKNRTIVLDAVSKDGNALKVVDEHLKSDVEIVKKAIARNCEAFSFASEDLKIKEDFVIGLLKVIDKKDYKSFFYMLPKEMRNIKLISTKLSEEYPSARHWLDPQNNNYFLNYLGYFDNQKPIDNEDNLFDFIDDYGINLNSNHFEILKNKYGVLIFNIDNSDYAWEELGGEEEFTIIYDLIQNRLLPNEKASPWEDDLSLIKKCQYLNSMHVGIYEPYMESKKFNGSFTISNYFKDEDKDENSFWVRFHGDEVDDKECNSEVLEILRNTFTPESMYEFISEVIRHF